MKDEGIRMPNTYQTTVSSVDYCGADVVIVRLAKPEGYSYKAGQWLRLTLDTPQGPETRTLSHAGGGDEDWIEVATRLSPSAFKQQLAKLGEGDPVTVSAPGGRPKLPSDAQEIACLVGGVGITPAISALRHARNEGRRFSDAAVFYGNRDETCEPYLSELADMGFMGVRVVRVLEHPPAHWEGERGFITADMVATHLEGEVDRPFLVAGPPVMVTAMTVVLDALGVAENLRYVEKFGTE